MKRALILGGLILLISNSCMQTPEDAELVKHMVVQTVYDTDRINSSENIFNSYSTFYIRLDTMGYVFNDPDADTILVDPIKDGNYEFVTPVVDEVKANVEMAGFTFVAEETSPDFAVKVVVLENFNYYQAISYPYYTGYYGYNGYYYPAVSTYYSNSATLLIEIVDLKNFTTNNNKYVVVWRAYIGDLLATLDLTGSTMEAIDRAFEQSPYINKD
jgi:hypothetical protein